MKYDKKIDNLMQFYTSGEYEAEVPGAKQEFYKLAGIFDEESPGFEMKMSQFVDWYLFTRELLGKTQTPARYALNDSSFIIQEEEKVYYQNLAASRHTLFEFLKLKGNDVHVKDLFSGYKLVIKKSDITIGFDPEALFEARLIPSEDNFVFGPSFCFHPPQATRFILKEIKKVKKLSEDQRDQSREELISRLFKMRHRFEQYRHVKLEEIYTLNSKLRL